MVLLGLIKSQRPSTLTKKRTAMELDMVLLGPVKSQRPSTFTIESHYTENF